MTPWARIQLKSRDGYDLSIRPAVAFRWLRAQPCFASESDANIRRAVWRSAAKIDLSIKKSDHAYWPPGNIAAMNKASAAVMGHEHNTTERELSTWFCRFGKVYVPATETGLPNRDEFENSVWEHCCEHWRKEEMPIPPYKWPSFKIRLLTEQRLGKAAERLSFACPLCGGNNLGRSGIHGSWVRPPDVLYCLECSKLKDDLEYFSSPRMQKALRASFAARHVPKPAPAGNRKLKERAVLRAIGELGLIQPGDLE